MGLIGYVFGVVLNLLSLAQLKVYARPIDIGLMRERIVLLGEIVALLSVYSFLHSTSVISPKNIIT